MEKAGFTNIAATLGLRTLLNKGMLQTIEVFDGVGTEHTTYGVTDKGMSWLLTNRDMLTLKLDDDDDVPF
jgi:hypothetical protein